MREAIWRVVAFIVSRKPVSDWLIKRAHRTPYSNITSRDGTDTYMVRLWLFNPYPPMDGPDERPQWRKGLPSIRIHHILRADDDAHLHDHPWNARTILLRGWYTEEFEHRYPTGASGRALRINSVGNTNRLLFGQYHRIGMVPDEGVWTLFITWKKQGTWGFLVDGVKVPWRKYLGIDA